MWSVEQISVFSTTLCTHQFGQNFLNNHQNACLGASLKQKLLHAALPPPAFEHEREHSGLALNETRFTRDRYNTIYDSSAPDQLEGRIFQVWFPGQSIDNSVN